VDDIDAKERTRRETMFLRLLIRATRAMTVELAKRLHARGYKELRPSYIGLLGNLDTTGTRLGALARRMGVSRQATSQLLEQIEESGFVVRADDPNDQRGVIVRHSARGRRLLADALDTMTEIEREYAGFIGEAEFKKLTQLLGTLVTEIDKGGELALE
jgi:DNA-binding MarR family transcriptional regulator